MQILTQETNPEGSMLQMSTSAQSVPFRKFELEERFPQKKM